MGVLLFCIAVIIAFLIGSYTDKREEAARWKNLFYDRDKKVKESEAEREHLIASNNDLQKRLASVRHDNDKLKALCPGFGDKPTPPPSPPKPPIHVDQFHYFFAWLEDDTEYKSIYKKIEKSKEGVCLSCKQPVDTDDALSLHSPLVIHRQCYENIYRDLSLVSSEEEAHSKFQAIPGKVSLLYWTLAHWPTYPPDWDVRRKRILEREHYACKKCGENEETLHVHHKKPIDEGGLHTPENLVCLCWHCHEKAHGHPIDINKTRDRDGKERESSFSKKMRLLKQAMQEHKTVHFHYLDTYGVESDRDLTPQSWPNPEEHHGAICVRGYCHLRNASRTFIVHRISRLTINPKAVNAGKE